MEETIGQENILPPSSQTAPPSSPLLPSSTYSTKPRKPPSVTPRRFGRFFTPRNSGHGSATSSRAGRELRDITKQANNRSLAPLDFGDAHVRKRRRTSPELPQSSPPDVVDGLRSSPCPGADLNEEQTIRSGKWKQPIQDEYPTPIRRSKAYQICPRPDYISNASNYTSSPSEHSLYGSAEAIPFSIAACHTNSLIAIGDEFGHIQILDTAKHSTPPFSHPFLTISPHTNAIMDLSFSHNDELLATASGDQTASIIDMKTQSKIYAMPDHAYSVKQVAFQPGSNSILATCSRDGTIGIWDTRARAKPTPSSTTELNPSKLLHPAHDISLNIKSTTPNSSPSTRSSPSITSLTFLSASRPHLFLTATDATATVKLWDIRMPLRATRRGTPASIPLSTTKPPPNHAKRPSGITSLTIDPTNTRLYALCRDSNLYVYSTLHTILGSDASTSSYAPLSPIENLRDTLTPRRPKVWPKTEKEGAAPLYALRNDRLRVGSFYVRASAGAGDDTPIAVGSSECGPVLFPRDEQSLARRKPMWAGGDACTDAPCNDGARDGGDKLPVYTTGTALEGAHTAEVTACAWARGPKELGRRPRGQSDRNTDEEFNGNETERLTEVEQLVEAYKDVLVTLSDDYSARVWRWEPTRAKAARRGRWAGWGWAEGGRYKPEESSDEE